MNKYSLYEKNACLILSQEKRYYLNSFLIGSGIVVLSGILLFTSKDYDISDIGMVILSGLFLVGLIACYAFFKSTRHDTLLSIDLTHGELLLENGLIYPIEEVGAVYSISAGLGEFEETMLEIELLRSPYSIY